MGFEAIEEMLMASQNDAQILWKIILEEDMKERHIEKKESMRQMAQMYSAMKSSIKAYDPKEKSNSHLVGGDAFKLEEAMYQGKLISGGFMNKVMLRAICVSECNACMKRIVAAPTAGSCGVLPAVLTTFQEERNVSDEEMVKALYIAAGIGEIIAKRASISGAEGGCQAEIGSASSMSAAALTYLNGGSASAISHAAAIALKNLLGLVCDPVAGLVEVPCVKRNVIGAINAIAAADMAVAGITSIIPPDEVIDAMASIGEQLPKSLKETAEGGLAMTPTGLKIAERL
nr:L-serine ammonia-lyase, iron-sulfur-dependent, subunit alpha [uncultured Cellulosilyticum sp.]